MMRHLPGIIALSLLCACAPGRDGPAIDRVAIAPDGQHLIMQYRSGKVHRLVYADLNTGSMRPIVQPANEYWRWPVLSTDGLWMAVSVCDTDRDGHAQQDTARIDVMRLDGSERRTIVAADGSAHGPFAFSPDGDRMVFAKGHLRESRAAINFDLYEVHLDGRAPALVADASFYQLSSAGYFGDRLYFTGFAPARYLAAARPPATYLPEASQADKLRWAMETNSVLYVSERTPDALTPFVTFDNAGDSVLPWQQKLEIESVRVAAHAQRLFAVMRHHEHPQGRTYAHYTRDVFVMQPDRSFRRLTHFNTVHFSGFDVTPDGRYLAVVPTPERTNAFKLPAIHRIDTLSGEEKVFRPDVSSLPTDQ